LIVCLTGSGRSFFPSLQPTSIVRSDSAAAASRSRFPICSRGFLGISAVVAPPWVFTARLSPHQIDISLSPSQKLSPSFLPRLLLSLYPIELKSLQSLIPLRSSSAIGPPFYQQLPASVSIGRAHRPQRNRRPPAAAGAPSPSPIGHVYLCFRNNLAMFFTWILQCLNLLRHSCFMQVVNGVTVMV
jgi:hypothetical protein